jgi:serine/threonine-protein kinase
VPQVIGRYVLFDRIASGGMASVHFGRLIGPAGFSRAVAIKRMHPQLAEDREFVSMFSDEANLAARVRHLNVIPTLDVVSGDGELLIVMEYVQGESLARLVAGTVARGGRVPVGAAAAVLSGVLHGLHAAHEATSRRGQPLGIVHRDVSPQNILVGVDGVARVLDFGVAKALGRLQTTREGQLKGKLGYMAPEQIHGRAVTRQADVFSAAVVLWEVLTGERLFKNDNDAALMQDVLNAEIMPPSAYYEDIPTSLDAVVMRGLSRDVGERFATAQDMASALEAAVPLSNPSQVGTWVRITARETIDKQVALLTQIESAPSTREARGADEAPTGPSPSLTPTRVDTPALAGASGTKAWIGRLALAAAVAATLTAGAVGLSLLKRSRPTPEAAASASVAARPSDASAATTKQLVGRVEWRVTAADGPATLAPVTKALRGVSCRLTTDYSVDMLKNARHDRPIFEGTGTLHLKLNGGGHSNPTFSGLEGLPFLTSDITQYLANTVGGQGWADIELTFSTQPLACSDADSNPAVRISFARDIRPLINRPDDLVQPGGCVPCHDTDQKPDPSERLLDLTRLGLLRKGGYTAGRQTMIVPGKPCDSVLVQVLRGQYPQRPCRMPINGPPYWSDAEIQLVMDWIAEGAQGDNEE